MTRQQAYTAACDPDLFDRFYHFILYRQLDKLDAYGLETLIQYARQSTQYIFLKAALTGDPLEAARRWSEQIEYDTENVGLLLDGISG
jgi:lysine-N-methylase